MSSIIEKHPELLNLGKEEAAIYSLLDREGESSARVISTICQIPSPRIYRILHKLQKQEIIVSCGKTPKVFALRCKDPGLIEKHK